MNFKVTLHRGEGRPTFLEHGYHHRKITGLSILVALPRAAQDVTNFDDKMLLSHSFRGTISAKPLSGALVRLSVSHALEQVPVRYPSLVEGVDDSYILGVNDGTTAGYFDWRQNIFDWLTLRARYSLIPYGNTIQPVYSVADGAIVEGSGKGEREGRYRTYHIGSLELTFTY